MLPLDPAIITGLILASVLFGGAWALAWRQEMAARRSLRLKAAPVPLRFAVVEGAGPSKTTPYLENCGMIARAA